MNVHVVEYSLRKKQMPEMNDIVSEHFKAQINDWVANFLGKEPGYEMMPSDWIQFGNRLKLFFGNIVNIDELFRKMLTAMSGDQLDELLALYNKRITAIRRETENRN